ncbi:protein FAM98B-like [Malaya genurostris]|uniref:protein FAM98B-like n=1 Tax=Malaya genurostris TaxID=325434 RepID=UPI0026F3EAD8|nr:protein FAM98B-like [Malaya genurostris]
MKTASFLLDLGYKTTENDEQRLEEIVQAGLANEEYRMLVQWLANSIKQYVEIDEDISSVDDVQCFGLELSSFLKELCCPYHDLREGPLSERYRQQSDAFMVVDFLAWELATHMILNRKNKAEDFSQTNLQRVEPNTATNLLQISKILQIETQSIIPNIYEQINDQLDNNPDTIKCELLFAPKKKLTVDQWRWIEKNHEELHEDLEIRLQMMLKRLDVLVSCFQWKKEYSSEVAKVYRPRRRIIHELATNMLESDIAFLLAADKSLLTQERVSSSRARGTGKNMFQGYLSLPDRGGTLKTDHVPVMPMWSSREEGHADESLRKKYQKQ